MVGLQVFGILLARRVPERFFCWAPYDALHAYTIEASLDGRALDDESILARYEVAARGTDNRSIAHLLGTIEWVEARSARPAKVTVRYTLNGGAETVWQCP